MFARIAQRRPLVLLAQRSHLDVSSRKVPQLCRTRLAPFPSYREYYQKRNGSADATVNSRIWNKIFGKYLLATNILSSGILMVFGDMVAQEIEYRRRDTESDEFDIKRERYDKKRIFRMFVVGSLQGPLHHFVYKWMDYVMPVANLKNTFRKILAAIYTRY
ncbi:unnamed protein product [Ceratitis capitata]|uniref:(Mediterranean fruit fly) hypothetical protein n=1 Tax=Ceratitis capitata TaxID=7213 RepID=A0A811V0D9_CERCA|nr:unnamed protein product [Ceratitis capitata]